MVIEADVGAMRNRLRLASKCIPMRYGVATHLGAKTTSDRPRSHIHAIEIESFFSASFAMRQKTPQSAAWRQ